MGLNPTNQEGHADQESHTADHDHKVHESPPIARRGLPTGVRAGMELGDITVTGPSGAVVTVTKTGDEVSVVGDGNKRYAEVATFDSGTAGSYTIKVASEGSLVAVAPALSTAAKGLAWIVAIILGAVVALIGLVLIVVGALRRSSSRSKRGAAPAERATDTPSIKPEL